MGQEVSLAHFSTKEYQTFSARLQQETQHLQQQLDTGNFSTQPPMGGFEKARSNQPLNGVIWRWNHPFSRPILAYSGVF